MFINVLGFIWHIITFCRIIIVWKERQRLIWEKRAPNDSCARKRNTISWILFVEKTFHIQCSRLPRSYTRATIFPSGVTIPLSIAWYGSRIFRIFHQRTEVVYYEPRTYAQRRWLGACFACYRLPFTFRPFVLLDGERANGRSFVWPALRNSRPTLFSFTPPIVSTILFPFS